MLAGLAALYFLLLGGRFDTFLIDPDVALVSLILLCGLARAGYVAAVR
ncbi:MAG: hypothetical protein HYU66_13745, partial [Armatimonadetes bacterium]|nr:hypothetical protein [Armatimonadota bacterium]